MKILNLIGISRSISIYSFSLHQLKNNRIRLPTVDQEMPDQTHSVLDVLSGQRASTQLTSAKLGYSVEVKELALWADLSPNVPEHRYGRSGKQSYHEVSRHNYQSYPRGSECANEKVLLQSSGVTTHGQPETYGHNTGGTDCLDQSHGKPRGLKRRGTL